ncbi:MAG: hypothetical protein ABR608_14370 [Pseudonocardiaceae bacterium]
MSTITIDAVELRAAAPAVAGMFATLGAISRGVNGVDVGALPASLAAKTQAELSEIHHELSRAANAVEGTAQELLERAGWAEAADQIGTLSLGLAAPGLTADLIAEAHKIGKAAYGVPDNVGSVASKAGYGLAVAGIIFDFAVPSVQDVANPYLDDTRKNANVLARATTTAGILVAGGVAAGLVAPALPAVAAAAVTGVALTVIDEKLQITKHLSDGINAGLEAADDAVDKAGDIAGDAVDKAGDVAGDAVDKAGDVAGDAVDKAGDVLGLS